MKLKKEMTFKVKEGTSLLNKFFLETERIPLEETRTVYVKRGEDPIVYKLETVKGISYSSLSYESLVRLMIREKYSIDEELAIQRQRDTKPNEFKEYFDYIENIKTQVKDFILERETYFDEEGNLKVIE